MMSETVEEKEQMHSHTENETVLLKPEGPKFKNIWLLKNRRGFKLNVKLLHIHHRDKSLCRLGNDKPNSQSFWPPDVKKIPPLASRNPRWIQCNFQRFLQNSISNKQDVCCDYVGFPMLEKKCMGRGCVKGKKYIYFLSNSSM